MERGIELTMAFSWRWASFLAAIVASNSIFIGGLHFHSDTFRREHEGDAEFRTVAAFFQRGFFDHDRERTGDPSSSPRDPALLDTRRRVLRGQEYRFLTGHHPLSSKSEFCVKHVKVERAEIVRAPWKIWRLC